MKNQIKKLIKNKKAATLEEILKFLLWAFILAVLIFAAVRIIKLAG
jgi:hypothetical protein